MSEARRLIRQGAVRVDGARITDIHHRIEPRGEDRIIQVGRRRLQAIRFDQQEKSENGA